jgi:hypothetical protein
MRYSRFISLLSVFMIAASGCSDTLPAPAGGDKDASVDSGQIVDSAPSFDTTVDAGPGVDSFNPDATVDSVSPDATVDSVSPDATVDSMSPDATVDSVSPDATVDSISPDATVDSISPDATMDAPVNWGTTGWYMEPNNPVLGTGNPADFDHGSVGAPVVIINQGVYQMWYTATDASDKGAVGYATSSDGVYWNKQASQTVLALGGTGSFDEKLIEPLSVIVTNGNYQMWYIGNDAQTNIRTGYAISVDGINWTKLGGGSLLPVGAPGAWDGLASIMMGVVLDDGYYVGMYVGANSLGSQAMGLAISTDGISWLKHAGNPVFMLPDPIAGPGSLIKTGSTYQFWYPLELGSAAKTPQGIFYASSKDAITWTIDPANPVIEPAAFGLWAKRNRGVTVLRNDAGTLKMWFAGDDGVYPTADGIGIATNP